MFRVAHHKGGGAVRIELATAKGVWACGRESGSGEAGAAARQGETLHGIWQPGYEAKTKNKVRFTCNPFYGGLGGG